VIGAALPSPGKALVSLSRSERGLSGEENHQAGLWQPAHHLRAASAASGSRQEEPGDRGLRVEPRRHRIGPPDQFTTCV